MDKMDYMRLAMETTIKYAAEQGIKLRRGDFLLFDGTYIPGDWIRVSYTGPAQIVVAVPYKGSWGKAIKAARDRFLNYLNARVLQDELWFCFTETELDLIKAKNEKIDDADEDKIEKVIRKINKLLAMADTSRGATEAEAISASLTAQKLLAQYNLTMTDVTGERTEEGVEQAIADLPTGKKWKYSLADTVADNYACKVYYVGNNQAVFYGYKADVLIARRVFVYLFKVGDKLANQYAKRYRDRYGDSEGIYNSFCSGFVNGVRKELEKQCTALALVVQPEVEDSFKEFSAGFGTINSNIKINDHYAYREGFVEGKRALNAQYIED